MRIQEKLLRVAMNEPSDFVAQITYLDKSGNVTERAVSPIAYLTNGTMSAYCLGREGLRTFKVASILRVQLRAIDDVLCPEAIKQLVTHRNKLRPD